MTDDSRQASPGGQALPKRFYKSADVISGESGLQIALDGRPARTPARKPLSFPNMALAEAVAEEWRAQGDVIDPRTMPLTRLANVAIDGVDTERAAVVAEIVKYAASDLVCYRADGPERLVARQTQSWDPVVFFAREDLGARFVLAQGVVFVEQPAEALQAVRRAVPHDRVFALTAVSVMTTLMGSALLALAVARGRWSAEEAWARAHVDDDWNAELWGEDSEAAQRRALRWREMQAAALMAKLA